MIPNDFLTSAYGVKIPRIIYGTAWKKATTTAWVEQAIGLGFRGIDTACQPKHYNEAGAVLAWPPVIKAASNVLSFICKLYSHR